jgi:lipoate-protein ligase A
MSEQWFLLQSGPGRAAYNMALDEALLEAAPRLGRPALRFYGWIEPAASFGYFQNYAAVERICSLRPLVRRPTGGGLVRHDGDWTYSLVFPANHRWHGLKAQDSYARAHQWMQQALARLGVATELARRAQPGAPGQCFAGAAPLDVLWGGRKIAGAAQRRTRHGLLLQGSVQPPALNLRRADWEAAVCAVAQAQWGVQWVPLAPDAALTQRADELARAKYAQPAFNRRR